MNCWDASVAPDVTVFADPAESLRADDAAERHFTVQVNIEVVLIGSDRLGNVHNTHASCFNGTAALERLLPAGQLASPPVDIHATQAKRLVTIWV